MNTKRIRMPLDILMTILSIILMGGTVLFPNDRVHQILGMTLLVLWAVHVILNRRWFGSLFKGRYAPHRIMQIVVNLGVLVCALLLMISGMMMAWFIPSEIVGGGLGFARIIHLIASHWYYVFMAFHIGLHASMIARIATQSSTSSTSQNSQNKLPSKKIIPLRVICIFISLYGVYAFITRGLWKYMFGLQQFFFFDFERGYLLFAIDYLSILVLFATMMHYAGKIKKQDCF
ncbi:MAG: DUF4405 domain-containing protein [Treponema sp.]|nr:DUF4405 domain-containing protein [Treponema sp.]